MKLNKLLAITQEQEKSWKNAILNYINFFARKGGAFLGYHKTYEEREGSFPEESMRGTKMVQSTVDEKLDWFSKSNKEYIKNVLTVEKTNSSGVSAELIVDGENWGTFTSLELLRLKGIVENAQLKAMYGNIPVRSDGKRWQRSINPEYDGRTIWETPVISDIKKTTTKTQFVLEDPNIGKSEAYNPTPQVATKNVLVPVGDWTSQEFSGEWSQRQRAELLRKLSNLGIAIIAALKECNDVAVLETNFNVDKLFEYLHS